MKIMPLHAPRIDVGAVQAALEAHAWLWNQNTARTADPESPHHGLDDIWVRFAAPSPGAFDAFKPHESVWLVPDHTLPVRGICEDIADRYGASRLGGVLITRIPPGGLCKPHTDPGWHAREYEKVAVQIKGNLRQAFHFEGQRFSALDGETYWFDNSHRHWVTNDSEESRITMIVCIKTDFFNRYKE